MYERASPLIETDAAPVIAELEGSTIVRSERISTGRTNVLRRVALADGRVLGVKQYARGRCYAIEGAAMRELADVLPVPEIVCTLDCVIAYRWIDGPALGATPLTSFPGLAVPLGRLLGALSRRIREAPPVALAPTRARLAQGRARDLLGEPLADALADLLAAQRFDEPPCAVHGNLVGDNVIAAPAFDGIAGIVDWEATTTGSPLHDVGAVFRYPHDAAFIAAFERAHGNLPVDWLRRARLLDATRLVAMLDHDAPGAALRDLVASVVASYR